MVSEVANRYPHATDPVVLALRAPSLGALWSQITFFSSLFTCPVTHGNLICAVYVPSVGGSSLLPMS